MKNVRRVLVPTDFSPGAEPALARGVDLARQLNAELYLLHVALLAEGSPMYPLFQTASSNVEAILTQVQESALNRLEELRNQIELPSRVHAQVKHSTSVAPTVTRYAREQGIDLIAIGTHGWRGMRRFLLGSVAEEVVREAHCPVITFRADATSPQKRPERILAAVDLSESSAAVIRYARKLGSLYHAKVDFLHVVPRYDAPSFYEPGHAEEVLAKAPEVEAAVLAELETQVNRISSDDCDRNYRVAHGRAWQQILEVARGESSDLIVIAARGYAKMPMVRLGSTAERVVRRATCPVFTVRGEGRTSTAVAPVDQAASG